MLSEKIKTTKRLEFYKDKEYIIKKRAEFLYYFIIAALVISAIMLFVSAYFQFRHPTFKQLNMPALVPILIAMLVYFICLNLLIKGKFALAANLFVITSLIAIWCVIFFDKSSEINRINTIVFIIASLSALPLVISKNWRVLFYGAINIVLFLAFIFYSYYYNNSFNISPFDFRETIFDIVFALIFSICVQYYILSINKIALNKTKEEIEERKKVANELQHHKDNLEKLVAEKTEQLEAFNEDLQAANDELYDKNELINEKNNELNKIITHLKETQSQLLQSEKMASLGTLTAGVSHELNNPLNYIMGAYVGLENYFKKNGSNDEKKTRFLLDSIKTGIQRSTDIINGLNQFSRDNSKFDEDCDVHSIIDNCLVMLYNKYKRKAEINKKYECQSIEVKGNVGKLHQVFVNIITNSIYAISEKGEITIETKRDEKDVVIEISDNGCGIESKNLPQITDPFFTTKPPGEGTGLGLSISYSIIKDHKGTIGFKSEVGKGTNAIIKIPYKTNSYEKQNKTALC